MTNNNTYGWIYIIQCKIDKKVYIGQTIQGFDRRYYGKGIKASSNRHLQFAIEKYGEENFKVDKEFDVAYSKEELDELEKWYIYLYNATNPKYGYNFQSGGHNGRPTKEVRRKISESGLSLNRKLTDEQRQEISQRQQGKKNSFYGKHHSKEQCEKWSKERKGVSKTEEHNRKNSEGVRRYYQENPYTDEQKQNLSRKAKEWHKNNKHPKSRAVRCLTTGEEFETCKAACLHYNLNRSQMCQHLKGRCKSVGVSSDGEPLIWQYI